jgi:uncharacterized membrane protein YozB (DUF420 family)
VEAAHERGALAGWLRRNFYFGMALLLVAIATYGFSQTFVDKLIRVPYPRPWLLFVHGSLVALWLLLFLTQTALARSHHLKLHRNLGWFALGVGTIMPLVGLVTAIVMDRLHIAHGEQNDFFPPFMSVHINDTAAFLVVFGLAAILRTKREFHGRLMFVATCLLMDAPLSRFPAFRASHFWITLAIAYAGVDVLILMGVARDWLVDRTVHVVYREALPWLLIGQAIATTLYAVAPPWWLAVCHAIIGA